MIEEKVLHEFPPVYNEYSKILILGSFPSVKSREQQFYYGHPQNRFWKVLSGVFQTVVPQSIAEKKTFLLSHGIALWDVIASCRITGSSDSSIHDVEVNDFQPILKTASIQTIYANGNAAGKYYEKYAKEKTGREIIILPSTSPANAAWSLEKLIEVYGKEIRKDD